QGGSAILDAQSQFRSHIRGIADAVAQADRLTRDRLAVALTGATLLASHGLLGPVLSPVLTQLDDVRSARELFQSAPAVLQTRAGILDRARRRTGGTVFSDALAREAEAAAADDARLLGLTANFFGVLIAVRQAQFLEPESARLLQALSRQPGA